MNFSSSLFLVVCTLGLGVVLTSTSKSNGFRSSVVYSFANVTSTPEGSHTSILTIATGPDGHLHYVRNEDGQKHQGIWTGPVPTTPKLEVEDILRDLSPSSNKTNNPPSSSIPGGLSNLSHEIDSSIQGYLSSALSLSRF